TVTMTIGGVNDSPSLTADATLAAVNEDTADPPGATVSDLFGASFSDPDTGASFAGIAVVGNTAAAGQGVWQYSTDGTNWADIGTVDDTGNGLALSTGTLVRFVPAADFFGTPDSLTVRALDDTY